MPDSQQVLVQVRFTIGDYSDALYFSQEEFSALKDEELEAQKTERLANWVTAIEAASKYVRPEPTAEELKQQVQVLQEQRDRAAKEWDEAAAKLLEKGVATSQRKDGEPPVFSPADVTPADVVVKD